MSLGLVFVPLLAAIGFAVVIGLTARVQFPSSAARFGVALTMAVVVAYVPSVVLLALGYLAHLPMLGSGVRWCTQAFGLHAAVPAVVGLPAIALVGAGLWGVVRLVRTTRRLRALSHDTSGVVQHGDPFAVVLPGHQGTVVVSSALVEMLDEREQAVVMAHERSHALHRHDRYLLAAELSAAVLPLLRPLADRVRLAVERWADEDAARAVGDREFVARTLGKVALQSHGAPRGALAFGGGQVVLRVAALLGAAPAPPRGHVRAWMWLGGVVATGLALVQVHHLEHLIAALCPH